MNFLKKTEGKIFLTVFLVYVFFISDYGGNWMADSMINSAMAFVDTGSFEIDNYIEGPKDNAFFNNHYYSGLPPGISFLVMPIYFITNPFLNLLPLTILGFPQLQMKVIFMNVISTIILSALSSALLSVLIYKLLKSFTKNKKIRILITIFFSFGTIFFVYSTELDKRAISAFLLFLAFFILYKIKHKGIQSSQRLIFLVGLILGFSIFVEYSSFVIVAILSLYLLTFLRNKDLLWYLFGIIIPVIALLSYHYYLFDDPFTTPYAHRASEKAVRMFSEGFMGVSTPNLWILYKVLFGLERGLFIYIPISILSLLGIILFFRNKTKYHLPEMLVISSIFILYLIFNASLVNNWLLGCSFGPRFLMPTLPFLMIPLVYTFKKINNKFIILIGVLSILINLLSVFYSPTGLWRGICGTSNPLKGYLSLISEKGLTNYTLNLIKEKIYDVSTFSINIITLLCLIIIGLIVFKIWKNK